jgi:hypothetical protein
MLAKYIAWARRTMIGARSGWQKHFPIGIGHCLAASVIVDPGEGLNFLLGPAWHRIKEKMK